MTTTMYYYIDGVNVSRLKAKRYFLSGVQQAIEYCIKHGLPEPLGTDAETLWSNRRDNADVIFNLTACQNDGGLEIILEED